MKMVKEWEGYPDKRLAIYIAPTKVWSVLILLPSSHYQALCYERSTDWAKRLPMVDPSLHCRSLPRMVLIAGIQVTGDTSNVDMSNTVKDATLIVTTVSQTLLSGHTFAEVSPRSGTRSRAEAARVRRF